MTHLEGQSFSYYYERSRYSFVEYPGPNYYVHSGTILDFPLQTSGENALTGILMKHGVIEMYFPLVSNNDDTMFGMKLMTTKHLREPDGTIHYSSRVYTRNQKLFDEPHELGNLTANAWRLCLPHKGQVAALYQDDFFEETIMNFLDTQHKVKLIIHEGSSCTITLNHNEITQTLIVKDFLSTNDPLGHHTTVFLPSGSEYHVSPGTQANLSHDGSELCTIQCAPKYTGPIHEELSATLNE